MKRETILLMLRDRYPQAVRIHFDGLYFHVVGKDRIGEVGLVRADRVQVKNLLGIK